MSEAPTELWADWDYNANDGVCGVHTHKKYASGYEPDFPPIRYVRADRIEELEAEVARLRQLVPRPDQTEDELVWRDRMRGVPLAALAKEFGVTKERMRHRLKRIAENKLHLKGKADE